MRHGPRDGAWIHRFSGGGWGGGGGLQLRPPTAAPPIERTALDDGRALSDTAQCWPHGLLCTQHAASVTEELPLHFVSFYFKRPPWWMEKNGPGDTWVQTGGHQGCIPATTPVRCPREACGTDNCYVWMVPQGTESPWRWVDSTIPPAPPSPAHAYIFRPLADVSVGQLHGDDLHVRPEGLPRAASDDGGKDQEAGGGGRLPQHRQDQLQKHLRADEGPDQLCRSRALRADGGGLRLPPLSAPRCSASVVPAFTCQKQPCRPVSS